MSLFEKNQLIRARMQDLANNLVRLNNSSSTKSTFDKIMSHIEEFEKVPVLIEEELKPKQQKSLWSFGFDCAVNGMNLDETKHAARVMIRLSPDEYSSSLALWGAENGWDAGRKQVKAMKK